MALILPQNLLNLLHQERLQAARRRQRALIAAAAVYDQESAGRGHIIVYFSLRSLKNLVRNPAVSILQVLSLIIFGVGVGAIYWQIDDSCTSGLQNRVGAFFFIIMNMVFGNLSAVEVFIKNSNFLGTDLSLTDSCYFLSLFLVSLSALALSFLLSTIIRIFAVANLLIAMCYVIMMVFSGLLGNLETVPAFLRWLKYFSIFTYSFNALSINELKDVEFVPDGSSNCPRKK